jgi:hypothetical protein
MIIPNKHSGYIAGQRLYNFGGGGSGGGDTAPIPIPTPAPPPPPPPTRGSLGNMGGPGRTYFQQNPDVAAAYTTNSGGLSPTAFAQQHYQNFGQYEGRIDPSQQFYQPVYQQQYQNYSMTNPFSVSQYNTPTATQPFNPYMPQFQPAFNPYTNSYGYGGIGMPTQPNYGPSRAIVSRSAGVSGAPPVVRRASGGIASLEIKK